MLVGKVGLLRQARSGVATKAPFPVKPHPGEGVAQVRQFRISVRVFALRKDRCCRVDVFELLKATLVSLRVENAAPILEVVVEEGAFVTAVGRFVLDLFSHDLEALPNLGEAQDITQRYRTFG